MMILWFVFLNFALFAPFAFPENPVLWENPAPISPSAPGAAVSLPPFEPSARIGLEAGLTLSKNNFLESPYSWSIEIPYAELSLGYNFSKKTAVLAEFDLSYKGKSWNYFIDNFFLQSEFDFLMSLSARAGYFFYPVSWAEENVKLFSKKTLLEKSLFPLEQKGLGLSLEGSLWRSFYWRASLQPSFAKARLSRQPPQKPVVTASLFYKKADQHIFVSYFKQDFFKSAARAAGLGADLSYKFRFLSLSFRGEMWGIKRQGPGYDVLSYYGFPAARWGPVSFGALFGGAHHYLPSGKARALEFALKADFYFTKNLFFTAERLFEWDSIAKKDSWAFSLKTNFEI